MVNNEELLNELERHIEIGGPLLSMFMKAKDIIVNNREDSIEWRERKRDEYLMIMSIRSYFK